MRNLLALVLAAITTCAAEDLKVTLVASLTKPKQADSASLPANKCPGSLCVSVWDDPIGQETIYVHGSSQRVEFEGIVDGQGPFPFGDLPLPPMSDGSIQVLSPHMAVITHCDTGHVIELDLDSHEYREFKQPRYPNERRFAKEVERVRKDAEKRVRWSTVDTGETKQVFGRTARHYITTIKEKLFSTEHQEVEDAWYVDLPEPGCAPSYLRQGEAEMFTFDTPSSTDVITSCNCLNLGGDWSGYRAYSTMLWAEQHFIPVGFREVTLADSTFPTSVMIDGQTVRMQNNFYSNWLYVGFTPRGLAVERKITGSIRRKTKNPSAGKEGFLETRIADLSDAPVDPALFQVPPGFKKVKHLYTHSQILQKVASTPQQ